MLETKINDLTKAVIALTEQMASMQQTMVVTKPLTETKPTLVESSEPVATVEPEPTPEPTKETTPAITADDLRDMCLALTRSDRSNKEKIKTLMVDKYNAKVVRDIDPSKYSEFAAELESL